MKKKPTRPRRTSTDPATRYAKRVTAGKAIAGPHVRAACERHLRDLEDGHKRGLSWHPDQVERVLGYFREVLTVEVEREDEFGETVSEAVPFEPHESQEFILGSLFGWKNKHGHRRFRRAYIEIGKGNGKSPLAAGIGHYMLTATGKIRAEVYSAATDRDQAAILFRDAVEMWQRSPALLNRLTPSGRNPVWQLTMLSKSSFFKPISSEKKGKSGIRPYCGLIDEVHEHPDNSVIEMLRAGTKGNQQALIFEITNSGHDRNSVCWEEHQYSIKVAAGTIENDSWFSFVCALDEDDDPFADESCWQKANPLLGVSIHPEYIREQVAEAEGMPNKESLVRRLNFCQWTEADTPWISREVWMAREKDLRISDFEGERCFGGLDLSYTVDLSCFAIVFPMDGDRYAAFAFYWKPKEGLRQAIKKDRVPYDVWAKNGYLELTPGKVIKLEPIARRIGEIAERFDLEVVAYDAYRHRELVDDLDDLGLILPMVEHPQGFRRTKGNPLWMPNSVQGYENAIVEARIDIDRNPVTRWNAANVVVREDPAGTDNKIFDKRKSTGRIDGMVAIAQAIGAAERQLDDSSPWDDENYRMDY